MKKEVIVISLGGSLIVPNKVDYIFLEKFKKVIKKNFRKHKFVIVCGGGSIAREYIATLKKQRKSIKEQSLAGIKATRMNAEIMIQLFDKETNQILPKSMKDVEISLRKNKVIFCGALRYAEKETSDGTAAKLAKFLKASFINMSNVKGLYNKNPNKFKNAKFIPRETWKKFKKRALKIKFKPGQHFVLDQNAAVIIEKNKIKTYLIGKNTINLHNLLNHKKFIGTVIEG